MTSLAKFDQSMTMSSREIAELTDKNHADVMRDVRKMISDLNLDESKFADIFFDSYNRKQPLFNLPYRETMILTSGYSIELRAKVVDRWMELESKAKFNLPQNYKEALLALVASEETKERLEFERNEAIRTKAYISDKKTATALQNSGHKTKIINKLNVQVDNLVQKLDELSDENAVLNEYIDKTINYVTVALMNAHHNKSFGYANLRQYSIDNGYEIIKVPDSRYGEVNAYHKAVWAAVYNVSI